MSEKFRKKPIIIEAINANNCRLAKELSDDKAKSVVK